MRASSLLATKTSLEMRKAGREKNRAFDIALNRCAAS